MQLRRLMRVCVAGIIVAGVALSITGCASIALPPSTVTPDLYSSFVKSGSDNMNNQSYVVFVRARTLSHMSYVAYQLYDRTKEMISAGLGSDHCHFYQTPAGKHTLGLSFVAGLGAQGSIPVLRFRFMEADLAPNKVYYLSINIGDTFLGGFVGGLQPISPRLNNNEKLPQWLATCQLVKFDAATVKKEWVERYSADFKPMFDEAFHEWQRQPNKRGLLPDDGFDGFVAAAASP